MKKLLNYILYLCAVILIAAFLHGKTAEPVKAQTQNEYLYSVNALVLPLIISQDISVNENAGTATFTFYNTSTDATASATTVNYQLQNGSAVAPGDFTNNTNSDTNFNIAPGETKTVDVPIIDDSAIEGDETFTMSISYNEGNEILTTNTYTATIVDNDKLITIDNPTVNENAGNATFTLTNTGPIDSNFDFSTSVAYSTGNSSAVSPDDYTETISNSDNRLFIPAGESRTVNVPIIDDSIIENAETFTLTISYLDARERRINDTGTATIIDNDTPAPSNPTNPGGPGDGRSDGKSSCPECTQPHNPPNTPGNPPATPGPGPFLSFLPDDDVLGDSITPTPAPSIFPTILPEGNNDQPQPSNDKPERPLLVKSIISPDEIPHDALTLGLSAAAAAFLVLLIVFPAEIFNATVQSNYDEISKWSLVHRSQMYAKRLSKLPALFLVTMFAIISSIINSFLSPDIGFNQTTLVMVLGMLLALVAIVTIYDLTRMIYMKKRFGVDSKLRAHSIGLFTGTVLVVISRLSNFLPGYCYGLFTGLVYGRAVKDKEEGEGLAASAVMLLAFGLLGWFLWVPIKEAALADNPSFLTLVFDSAFASFWVSALTATIFGLLPMRFVYGEQVKKWNSRVWAVIYFTGVFLFVYTLLNPAIGIYGKTDKVSWIAVLSLFIGFGLFSLSFWGYFRYRANFGWKPKKS